MSRREPLDRRPRRSSWSIGGGALILRRAGAAATKLRGGALDLGRPVPATPRPRPFSQSVHGYTFSTYTHGQSVRAAAAVHAVVRASDPRPYAQASQAMGFLNVEKAHGQALSQALSRPQSLRASGSQSQALRAFDLRGPHSHAKGPRLTIIASCHEALRRRHIRVRSADTVLMSQTKGSGTYGVFVNSSTASGSSTKVQARQTRPRSQFGQNRESG